MYTTRMEIVDKIAKKSGLPKVRIHAIVKDFLRHINGAMLKGEVVWIRHFGIFKVVKRKARIGRNPLTNLPIKIPAKKQIVFKNCSAMKERLNAR